jgi:hypothetical protein
MHMLTAYTTDLALPTRPGDVVDIHTWSLRVPSPMGRPGDGDRSPAHDLRVRGAFDRTTGLGLGLVVSGDPTEDLAPTALRMAMSDKTGHARAAGALADWNERAVPRTVVTVADETTMGERLSDLTAALRIDLCLHPHLWLVGGRGFTRTFRDEAAQLAGAVVDDLGRETATPVEAEAVAAGVQAALVRYLVDRHNRTHTRTLAGRTPAEAWHDGQRIHGVRLPAEASIGAFAVEGASRGIERRGIQVLGVWYQAPILAAMHRAGERFAKIRLDPADLDRIDVWSGESWVSARRAAPPSDDGSSVEQRSSDRRLTRGVAAQSGTLHLCHERAWRRAGRDGDASRRTGE